MEAVGLVKRGGGDSRQILITARSEYPGEEVALPRGLRGRRPQLLRSLWDDNKFMRPGVCAETKNSPGVGPLNLDRNSRSCLMKTWCESGNR